MYIQTSFGCAFILFDGFIVCSCSEALATAREDQGVLDGKNYQNSGATFEKKSFPEKEAYVFPQDLSETLGVYGEDGQA